MREKGICVAGNIIMDVLYSIKGYPALGELADITKWAERSSGGLVCNCLRDLANLDPELPLQAIGRVGDDDGGSFVLGRLTEFPNIDVSPVISSGVSSITMVMADEITGQRTFFYHHGASAEFTEDDIDWSKIHGDILHIGYILCLDELDKPDEVYGTKMARLLCHAQDHGMRTSVDVVSETTGKIKKIMPPALRYTNYCIINELEAEQCTGIRLRDENGMLLEEELPKALARLHEMGVSEWAVVHCPELGCGMDQDGRYVSLPSVKLPKGYIKGTVGAGDAYCSGVLLAAERGWTLEQALELGTAAAIGCLSKEDAATGVKSAEEALRDYRALRDQMK